MQCMREVLAHLRLRRVSRPAKEAAARVIRNVADCKLRSLANHSLVGFGTRHDIPSDMVSRMA